MGEVTCKNHIIVKDPTPEYVKNSAIQQEKGRKLKGKMGRGPERSPYHRRNPNGQGNMKSCWTYKSSNWCQAILPNHQGIPILPIYQGIPKQSTAWVKLKKTGKTKCWWGHSSAKAHVFWWEGDADKPLRKLFFHHGLRLNSRQTPWLNNFTRSTKIPRPNNFTCSTKM